MTTTRRPATIAELTIGAHVYKGNGKTLYRVWGVREDGAASVVKASTEKNPTRGCWYPLGTFTVDATETFEEESAEHEWAILDAIAAEEGEDAAELPSLAEIEAEATARSPYVAAKLARAEVAEAAELAARERAAETKPVYTLTDRESSGTVSPMDAAITAKELPTMTTAIASTAKFSTREEWLVAAVDAMGRSIFKDADITLPAIRVSVGWPGGRGKKENVIGQCWPTGLAADGVAQLFVSPVLNDGARVLDVLAHELIHAADDCQNGHKGPFAKMAKAIGLTGKMTATVASPELVEKLTVLVEELGLYPHSELASGRGSHTPKKQGTRMVKVECPADGYTLRTTRKWLEVGVPTCPCGTEMVADIPAEDPDADDE